MNISANKGQRAVWLQDAGTVPPAVQSSRSLRGTIGLLSYIMRSESEESLMFRLVLITVINTAELPGLGSYFCLPDSLMRLFSNSAMTTSLFSALSPDNNALHLPPPSPPSACSTRSVLISSCQLLPEAVTVRVFMPCGFWGFATWCPQSS